MATPGGRAEGMQPGKLLRTLLFVIFCFLSPEVEALVHCIHCLFFFYVSEIFHNTNNILTHQCHFQDFMPKK